MLCYNIYMDLQKPYVQAPLAEDIAYTVNHALACTATDILNPYIGNLTQRYLGRRVNVGCNHDHDTPPAPDAPAPKLHNNGLGKGLFTSLIDKDSPKEGGYKRLRSVDLCEHGIPLTPAKSNLKHWWVGEIAGDFGAVPITVAAQRMMPGLMDSIRDLAEPILGPFFHFGAKRSARIWAEENHVDVNSKECKDHEQQTYAREMQHLPQAFMWTASSVALNIGAQRISGNKGEFLHLLAGKTIGAATSAAAVLGFRSFAPHQAYKWDGFTSEHIFTPVAHAVKKAVNASWQERVGTEQPETKREI